VDAVADEHFLVASTPQQHADAVVRILQSPVERRRLSVAGRQRMLSHHAWEHSVRRLDRIIERCLSRRRAAGPPTVTTAFRANPGGDRQP
ncbi:MAG: glycosyltransferase family protein, partial [Candidatus Rokuibacteriota bacterium]